MARTGAQIVWDAYKSGVLSAEKAIQSLQGLAQSGGVGGEQAARLLRHFGVTAPGYEDKVTQGTTGTPPPADTGDALTLSDLLNLGGAGAGGGGASYRPQTSEEAGNLLAQSKLFAAQTENIPKAQELARRKTFAEVGLAQAQAAANPRRIFEAIYGQARLKMPELAKSLQEKVNLPGFSHGASVKDKDVAGPVLALVGKNDDEFALLAPGSVVAPKQAGDKADVATAKRRIFEQVAKGKPAKAQAPPRLKKAQGGLDLFGLPPEVIAELEALREQTTGVVTDATKGATGGTSLFDPLAGSTFTDEQSGFFSGLNLRDFGKLSPTQRKAAFSTLSANRVEPEDYLESLTRQFAGFNPVKAGTRAKFSGILGR